MPPSPSYFPVVPNRFPYSEVATDFPVTGGTAQTATPLAVQLEPFAKYVVTVAAIFSNSSAAASAGLSFSGPAGASLKWNNTTGSTGYKATIGGVDSYTGSTALREAFLIGKCVTGATGGLLALTLSTSDGAQTSTLAADSWLLAQRVG